MHLWREAGALAGAWTGQDLARNKEETKKEVMSCTQKMDKMYWIPTSKSLKSPR